MGEIRKDYILDHWAVIVPKRGKRPHEFDQETEEEEQPEISPTCPFCVGNEDKTPPELGRIATEDEKGWQVRWFDNKFAAFEHDAEPAIRTDNEFYTHGQNFGYHQVIVEINKHNRQLHDLSIPEITNVLLAYRDRIETLEKLPGVEYVNIIKNHGSEAGTSLVHSHSQVMATHIHNQHVQEKIEARKEHEECPWCEIVDREKDSDRRVFENDNWVAFTPYASRYKYECWIYPKNHIRNLRESDDLQGLAQALKHVISKLSTIKASYNYLVYYSPEGEDLHFHIEIMPRIPSPWGAYEHGSHVIINTVSPEDAAEWYRDQE